MPELEDRLRESIRRHADRVELEPTVPESMLRRARRRIALTVGLACAIVVSAVGGGWALVAGIDRDREHRPAQTPTPPAPSPVSEEDAVRAAVREFMDARMSASAPDHRAEAMVNEDAETKYLSRHPNGVFLYSPAPELEWDTWETLRLEEAGERWEAQVEVTERYSGPLAIGGEDTRTFGETLTLRPAGGAELEIAEFMVIDVERRPPADLRHPVWRLHDFLLARAAGRGAEPYLAPTGAASYETGDGLHLYPEYEWMGDLVLSAVSGSEAVVRITDGEIGDTPWCPHTEVLQLDGDGSILYAERPSEGWRHGRLDGSAAGELACAFLDAREAGDAERYLGPEAAAQYESGEQGLSLYEGICDRWMAVSDTHGQETPDGVLVRIRLCTHHPEGVFAEDVLVAPGEDLDGNAQPALVVEVIARVDLPPAF
ncbi:MAG: hypothetical protein WD770_02535 [Actinomycetota bacterium]